MSSPNLAPGRGRITLLVEYRLYCLGSDGRICRSVEFGAQDDLEAISLSDVWRKNGPAELWSGARFIQKLPNGPAS